jgi:hypothetical protein
MKVKFLVFYWIGFFCFFTKGHSQSLNIPAPRVDDPSHLVKNELQTLDLLIEATQLNLKNLTKLKEHLQKYQELQDRYLKNSDNEVLFQMIKTAHVILEGIKEAHLTQSFDPAFLSELSIISKPATKLGIPRP